jgi:hypothetical protein
MVRSFHRLERQQSRFRRQREFPGLVKDPTAIFPYDRKLELIKRLGVVKNWREHRLGGDSLAKVKIYSGARCSAAAV